MPQVSKLYAEFQAAIAASKALPEGDEKSFNRAVAKASTIAAAIVKAPARNVDEMLLKIEVVDQSEGDGLELDALMSLREDLHQLQRQATLVPA